MEEVERHSCISALSVSPSLTPPKPRSGSGGGVTQAEVRELQTQLLETRLLYTTTIEDYDVVCVVHCMTLYQDQEFFITLY